MSGAGQPLLRELIDIPRSVGDSDFVIEASARADLAKYVVTEDLRRNFDSALRLIGHAMTSGRSQAAFLHGSFGSGKSHFMAVLREILAGNPAAAEVPGLAEPVAGASTWLPGRRILTLTFHMLSAVSVEQAILEGYLNQITALRPDAPPPPVHRSDAMLTDAAKLRAQIGDDEFFTMLRRGGGPTGGGDGGLAVRRAVKDGWTAQNYADAASAAPGTKARDQLVSALTTVFYTGAVRSGEYLDLDTGLAVITRHAKALGYDGIVFFLDELILWLSTKIAEHTFVSTEGAKLNKLVESSDAARPLPIVSFVARQRNLEEFLGPQVGGTEREALATVMRSVQGRLKNDFVFADSNLPEIVEKRLLKPVDEAARRTFDAAFSAVRGNREVWDILLLGAQFGDAGIGSDAEAFRRLYPFSPALVATLVALSQALQRERTALRVMTELLVERRDTLRVNDLIGVATLFDRLVLEGELPDRLELRQSFRAARDTYRRKLRPLLLASHELAADADPTGHEGFELDDRLIKTLLLGALVPDVPALHNLTAAKLHALNFGSISSPIPGYENQVVLSRLRRFADSAGELHFGDGPDPVITLTLSSVDYDKLLDLVPYEETSSAVRQQLIRELICAELGLPSAEGTFGDLPYQREWRGRRHTVHVRFGNVRDRDLLPASVLAVPGDEWRLIIDYPFDPGHPRTADFSRVEDLERGYRTVFWLPLFLSDDVMTRVVQLVKINYLLGNAGGGSGERLNTLAADWSLVERQQGRAYLQQRQHQLRGSLIGALKQAYGVVKAEPTEVEDDSVGVLRTLTDGLQLGDPRGGNLKAAFDNLTAELLEWSYPGTPALPENEKPITRAELAKVFGYAHQAAGEQTHGVNVAQPDQKSLRRICNPLRLGEQVEHRYVLTGSTCWWSQHLVQSAALAGYTESYPVGLLRGLLDKPQPRGLDRDLQNLIIAVFALEQQLAWYHPQHGGLLKVASVLDVRDEYVLRPPPMPTEGEWELAVKYGQPFFGRVLPTWRSPANLSVLVGLVREEASKYVKDVQALVPALEARAGVLGLDLTASGGRLAAARWAGDLLAALAGESDDVVVVREIARAGFGGPGGTGEGLEPLAASVVVKTAVSVAAALTDQRDWDLIDVVFARATYDATARTILDTLRKVAGHQQHAEDLATGVRAAAAAAARLLATDGGGSGAPGRVTGPTRPGVDTTGPAGSTEQSREISTLTEWDQTAKELRDAVLSGRRVVLRWEIQ